MHTKPGFARTSTYMHDLFEKIQPRDFVIKLWDGTSLSSDNGNAPRFSLVVQNPGALKTLLLQPKELSLGEAYIYNDVDIEGELEEALGLAGRLAASRLPFLQRLGVLAHILRFPSTPHEQIGRQAANLSGRRHSIQRDRQAVSYHYNVSNDFYRLWLDRRMVYSTAYFVDPGDSLDAAQERKLDYICRKLRLKKGDSLLDIGCGWGGLIMHAARRFGVKCLGITLSQPQVELANERIRSKGLSDCCRVEEKDYRDVDTPGIFDKLVSVGMFEHVGASRLPEYFRKAWRLLRPGGLFLNHGIAQTTAEPKRKTASFSDRYVFPDSEVLPVSTTLRVAEEVGFEIRDVESLREHYVLTLRSWVKRLEAHYEEAVRLTDEATYRIWRLYMSASAQRFASGRLNVYQALMVKPDAGRSGLPLTRADWYA